MPPSPNLLIVDDSKESLLLLSTTIRKLNVNLIQAASASEALSKVQGKKLALAIIDVRMPGVNGYELAEELNETRDTEKVPVIFLTADDYSEMELFKGYHSGAVDYLFKPFNSHILLSKIRIFLDLYDQKQKVVENTRLLQKSTEELIRANEALRKREEKLEQEQVFTQAVLNSIPGIFYLFTFPELQLINRNQQYETLLEEQATIASDQHFLSPLLAKANSMIGMPPAKNNQSEQIVVETELCDRKGQTIPYLLTGVIFENQQQKYIIGVGTDLSSRKKTEQELKESLEQLHQLSQYMEEVRENERIAISRELHDDLGQALTAVKIDLGIATQQVEDLPLRDKLEKTTAAIGHIIKTVQRLTSELRLDIIDDLGLESAIEWYAKEFEKRYGISVSLQIAPNTELSHKDSLTLFRILQESLTNICRHSKASQVIISMNETDGSIYFTVSDNGIGIAGSQIQSKKSFGLISMKERATILKGTFDIHTPAKGGTNIKIVFPYPKNIASCRS